MDFTEYTERRLKSLIEQKKELEGMLDQFISEIGVSAIITKDGVSLKQTQRKLMVIKARINEIELLYHNVIPNYSNG